MTCPVCPGVCVCPPETVRAERPKVVDLKGRAVPLVHASLPPDVEAARLRERVSELTAGLGVISRRLVRIEDPLAEECLEICRALLVEP